MLAYTLKFSMGLMHKLLEAMNIIWSLKLASLIFYFLSSYYSCTFVVLYLCPTFLQLYAWEFVLLLFPFISLLLFEGVCTCASLYNLSNGIVLPVWIACLFPSLSSVSGFMYEEYYTHIDAYVHVCERIV